MIGAILPSGDGAAAHERKPDIHARGRIHFRRHHANDRDRTAMKCNRAPNNLRVAVKGAVPQTIADDRERRRARFVFVFAVGPAELRLEADRVEEICGRERNGDPLRLTPGNVAEMEGFEAGQREMLKRSAVAPPIDVIRQRDRGICSVDDFVQVNEPIRLRIGQRPEQDVVDDAEDGAVRADAEREGEHGDDGEARRFAELAESEAEIVHGIFPFC